ncbi:chitinase [Leptodontidium sp. MPI-SDFR-AT-0119]|nr:chitinase [Leptodontidium sp. MPI-SDFR-AT-0119]
MIVCCSKWGFCGLTEEFCGTKKVKRPSCDSSGSVNRVVGYYEGWASKRTCNAFYPEDVPSGVYSHINFAFATIDPVTFEVRPASTADVKLYTRLTSLKDLDPDLKANQKAFIKSLIAFMPTYNFDGVDIDWEYPGADDRSGRPTDFANFPKFMANLKSSLKATGGRDGLTITIPASYWYLQHFDIKNLVKSVDWFNIMTYDLHGTWDKGNKWLGNFLNAHTNLTEITAAMDLLWRNDISADKVVMGMAFYGRAFTVTSTNCVTPGCTFESGANKGPCSAEISILMNSEIKEIVETKGLNPVLYKDAAVKVASWDDQWVAYDDADTFKLKLDFARSQCLGGVMIWAISHDTLDSEYSEAFATTACSNVKLYNKCEWASLDGHCDAFTCPYADANKNQQLVLSSTGNGGAECNVRSFSWGNPIAVQERKYCCDESDTAATWSGCKWVKDLLPGPAGRTADNFCYSNCPDGLVRVAMDKYGDGCGVKSEAKGDRAYCCTPDYTTTQVVVDRDLLEYTADIEEFLEEGSCQYDAVFGKRDMVFAMNTSTETALEACANSLLVARDKSASQIATAYMCYRMIRQVGTAAELKPVSGAWDNTFGTKWPNLQLSRLKEYFLGYIALVSDGVQATCDRLVCNLDYFSQMIGGTQVNCNVDLCTINSGLCCDPEGTESETCSIAKRDPDPLLAKASAKFRERQLEEAYWVEPISRRDSNGKRGIGYNQLYDSALSIKG